MSLKDTPDPSSKQDEELHFRADRTPPGSIEHFWHYLLGVLLPLLHLHRRNRGLFSKRRIVLPPCGPVMDGCGLQVLSGLGLDAAIGVESPLKHVFQELRKRPEYKKRLMARRRANSVPWKIPEEGDSIRLPRWDHRLKFGGADDPAFFRAMRETALHFVGLAQTRGCCHDHPGGDAYVLLKRSAELPFYRAGGGAENPGYGQGRHSLEGLEACQDDLNERGLPTEIYEPGAHDLFCQARTLARARGIVGIRGAEFANMVWLKPDALAVLVAIPSLKRPPPQPALAQAMGIVGLVQLTLDPETPQTLNAESLARIIHQHEKGSAPTSGQGENEAPANFSEME
jgi:hypothetical protein